jgi:ParB family chromosome partitioning protein
MEFADKELVIDWIINNQLGRRNLTPTNQSYLRGLQYQREKKKVSNEKGVNQFSEVRGNNCTQPKTAERLAEQHNVSPRTIKNDAEYTKAVDEVVSNTAPEVKQQILNREIPITKKDTLEIAKAEPEEQKEIIRQVVSGESKTVKEAIEKKAPHVSYNSGNNEWYTPEQYILAAKEVMGEIDLDPASSEFANQVVGAKQIYTVDDDGLAKEWAGKVWLNPPYAGELVSLFCNKIAEHYNNGDVTEAIILVNNATETGWFGTLIEPASSVVFLKGRVRYYTVDGTKNTPLQGQAVVYMGKSPDKFLQCFSRLGWGAML